MNGNFIVGHAAFYPCRIPVPQPEMRKPRVRVKRRKKVRLVRRVTKP